MTIAMKPLKVKPVTEWRLRNEGGGYDCFAFHRKKAAMVAKTRMAYPNDWSVIRVEIRPVEKKK